MSTSYSIIQGSKVEHRLFVLSFHQLAMLFIYVYNFTWTRQIHETKFLLYTNLKNINDLFLKKILFQERKRKRRNLVCLQVVCVSFCRIVYNVIYFELKELVRC